MLYVEEGNALLHNNPRSSQCPVELRQVFNRTAIYFSTDIYINTNGTVVQSSYDIIAVIIVALPKEFSLALSLTH